MTNQNPGRWYAYGYRTKQDAIDAIEADTPEWLSECENPRPVSYKTSDGRTRWGVKVDD